MSGDTGYPNDAELAQRLKLAKDRRAKAWAELCDADAHLKHLERETRRRFEATLDQYKDPKP